MGIAVRLRGLSGSRKRSETAAAVRGLAATLTAVGGSVQPPARPEGQPYPAARASHDHVDSARAESVDLLADIEQFRPGLTRNRALALVGGLSSSAEALRESFDTCDTVSADMAEQLSFADETFDLVYAALPSPVPIMEITGEILRVLRLLGIAVMDFASDHQLYTAVLPPGPQDALQARVAASEELLLAGGQPAELVVTVTNTGATMLGSAVSPLRVQASWCSAAGAGAVAAETVIDAILLPGTSIDETLVIAAPDAPGPHVLQLSLVLHEPWRERRSDAAYVLVSVAPRDSSGNQLVAPSAPLQPDVLVAAAVARAGGQILDVRSLAPGGGQRWFFARA